MFNKNNIWILKAASALLFTSVTGCKTVATQSEVQNFNGFGGQQDAAYEVTNVRKVDAIGDAFLVQAVNVTPPFGPSANGFSQSPKPWVYLLIPSADPSRPKFVANCMRMVRSTEGTNLTFRLAVNFGTFPSLKAYGDGHAIYTVNAPQVKSCQLVNGLAAGNNGRPSFGPH